MDGRILNLLVVRKVEVCIQNQGIEEVEKLCMLVCWPVCDKWLFVFMDVNWALQCLRIGNANPIASAAKNMVMNVFIVKPPDEAAAKCRPNL
jgi:hypothetical protein